MMTFKASSKKNDLNKNEHEFIKSLLNEFKDFFFVIGDTLSATTEICHKIITTTDKPLYSKIYRYPQFHENEIQRQIKGLLKQNIIREVQNRVWFASQCFAFSYSYKTAKANSKVEETKTNSLALLPQSAQRLISKRSLLLTAFQLLWFR